MNFILSFAILVSNLCILLSFSSCYKCYIWHIHACHEILLMDVEIYAMEYFWWSWDFFWSSRIGFVWKHNMKGNYDMFIGGTMVLSCFLSPELEFVYHSSTWNCYWICQDSAWLKLCWENSNLKMLTYLFRYTFIYLFVSACTMGQL